LPKRAHWVFRGQSDINRKLIPTAGRPVGGPPNTASKAAAISERSGYLRYTDTHLEALETVGASDHKGVRHNSSRGQPMNDNRKLSPSLRNAFGVFAAVAGLIGVAVTVWTAPSTPRTVSLCVLFGSALALAAGIGIREILRHRRLKTTLPSLPVFHSVATPYRVVQATPDEIGWIARLEESIYSGADAIPEPLLREWYSANDTGFSIVKAADGRPVGHLDILPLRPKTMELFLKGEIVEREIRGDSLYSPKQRRSIRHLYIESIILSQPKGLTNAAALVHVLSNIALIVERVADLPRVERIYAMAASTPGEDFMRDLGFEMHTDGGRRKDGHDLFAVQPAVIARNVLRLCGEKVLQADALKTLAGGA